jgi:hypothetical protein
MILKTPLSKDWGVFLVSVEMFLPNNWRKYSGQFLQRYIADNQYQTGSRFSYVLNMLRPYLESGSLEQIVKQLSGNSEGSAFFVNC